MTARLGVVLLLTLVAAPARAELKIEKIEPCYGPLGPVRTSLDVYPQDEVYFRFVVTGAKTNDAGQIDCTLTLQAADANGKALLKENTPLKGPLALGGNTFPGNARLRLGPRLQPGTYTLTVTIKDNLSGESASFSREVTAKEPGFRLVAPSFFRDAEGRVPCPAGGTLSQALHFQIKAIGFKHGKDRIDTEMSMEVLDTEGKPVLAKPLVRPISREGDDVKNVGTINLSGNIVLNRVGDFRLRITLTDRIGKQTATFEAPVRVTAP